MSDEPDYVGLQADLDELEAIDPDVAKAVERLDAATRVIKEAHRKVAALPASPRRDQMLGFLNAELEAADRRTR